MLQADRLLSVIDAARSRGGGGRPSIRALNDNANERLNKLGDVTLNDVLVAATFARMLAKIAHAHAVAKRGLGSFKPLALEAILSEEPSDI